MLGAKYNLQSERTFETPCISVSCVYFISVLVAIRRHYNVFVLGAMLKRLSRQGPKSLALLIQDQELVPHPHLEDQHLPQDPPQKKAGLQVRFVSVASSLLSTSEVSVGRS